jgi:hypothetical protein
MKMKKALGFLTVTAAAAVLMCASAYAATYTVGATSATAGSTITVPVKVVPGADETASVNGYVVELEYDSTVLTPVKQANDVLDEDCYAKSSLTDGVLVSNVVDVADSTKDKVVVAWAAASPETTTEELELATVQFTVNSAATVSSTAVGVVLVEAASDSTTMDETSEVLGGTITLGSEFLRGDADGNGKITIADASLIARHVTNIQLITDEVALARADANNDGKITIADASAVARDVANIEKISQ